MGCVEHMRNDEGLGLCKSTTALHSEAHNTPVEACQNGSER
jgi:hypothetical protein